MGRKGVRDEVLVWWEGCFCAVVRLAFSLGLRDAKVPLRRVGIEGDDIVDERSMERNR